MSDLEELDDIAESTKPNSDRNGETRGRKAGWWAKKIKPRMKRSSKAGRKSPRKITLAERA